MGLAKRKFSESIKKIGNFNEKNNKKKINKIIVIKSLIKKYEQNSILSSCRLHPRGLEDPFSCKKNKWAKTKTKRTKGKMKWREKNRFNVGSSTLKPPHTHSTKNCPIMGITEIKFVITVAPQNDIWPHGRT